MFISLKSVVDSQEFKDVKILAGKDGLYRNITSISVNDLKTEFMSPETIETGDLFITSLHQYAGEENPEAAAGYVQTLIDHNCSGLIVVTPDNLRFITGDIIRKCDEARFPLLYFSEAKKYSDIMKTVNKYIAIEIYNSSRIFRLQKVLSEKLSEEEILAILDSLESNIQTCISVIAFTGKAASEILKKEFEVNALASSRDAFVDCNYIKYYIISARTPELLSRHMNSTKDKIKEYYNVSAMGISGVYEKRKFKKALVEAANANKIARATNVTEFYFPRVSSYNIIASTADTEEAKEYYESVLSILNEHTSPQHREEVIETVIAFVNNKGDFKLTAKSINQHENTVRYRLNRLRSWLDMEDDGIAFYETVSLIAKYSLFCN